MSNEKDNAGMDEFIKPLGINIARWEQLTYNISARSGKNMDELGAASFDYLMYSGYTVLAYLWARTALVALQKLAEGNSEIDFYQAKLHTSRFYFQRILPRNEALAVTMIASVESLMDINEDQF